MIEIGNRIETPEGVFYELEYGGEGNIYKNEDAFLKTVFCPKAPAPAWSRAGSPAQRLTLQTGRRRRLHRCRAAARPASGRACP